MKRIFFALFCMIFLVSCGSEARVNENLASPTRAIATLGEVVAYIEDGELRGVEIAGEAPDDVVALTSDGERFILLCGDGIRRYRIATLVPGGEVDFDSLDAMLESAGEKLPTTSHYTDIFATERYIVVSFDPMYNQFYVLDLEKETVTSGFVYDRLFYALEGFIHCDGGKIYYQAFEKMSGQSEVIFDASESFAGYNDNGSGIIRLLAVDPTSGDCYFRAESDAGCELWKFGETAEKLYTHPERIRSAQLNGELYFADVSAVYRLDGDKAVKLADATPPVLGALHSPSFTVLDGRLYHDLTDFAKFIEVTK